MSLLDELLNNQPDQGALGPQGRDILSDYLLGPSQAAAPSSVPAPTTSPQQTPAAAAQVMPGVSSPQQTPNPMADMDVTGWKPEHRTTLGTIADTVLSLLSGHVVMPFHDRAEEHNVQHAMEGFTSDPLDTIRKMSRIPGMENKALSLYQQYVTDNRQQGNLDRQNTILDRMNLADFWNRAGSGMKSTLGPDGTPDPVKWGKLRNIMTQLGINTYHLDPALVNSVIPEQPDADAIDNIYAGAIKPAQQEKINTGNANAGEHVRHDKVTEGQQATNEAGRNSRFATGEAGKNSRQQTGIAARQQGKPVAPGADGEVRWYLDGNHAVKFQNGKWHGFARGPDGKMQQTGWTK